METYFDAMAREELEVSRDKLIGDLKTLAHDAEELLKVTAGEVGEKAKEARNRLAATLESAKESCRRLEEKTIATAKAADKVIREHPYQSIGVAFGVGLLIGVLINRK
jgi:ElaB/YqjD/DUF883 family membrane-anchored ribosome-binding protein